MYARLMLSILLLINANASWANRFIPGEQCVDSEKICIDNADRLIDGFKVSQPCWTYTYKKTCQFPSQDNCKNFTHCYWVADHPCLLTDNYGNCVNLQKEFSCKSWEPVSVEVNLVETELEAKPGVAKILCKGQIPCLDGNCFDKRYAVNDEMLASISQLTALSKIKGADGLNFQLFTGEAKSCTKKKTEYTNCCSTRLKGWGTNLGARCKPDEKALMELRKRNLCVYVGKKKHRHSGVNTSVSHHYCCFSNLFNKVFQVAGRKQLGLTFGSGDEPNCRGLTLTEIMQLDFTKLDFSEFYQEIVQQMQKPNLGDINQRISDSMLNIQDSSCATNDLNPKLMLPEDDDAQQ